MRRASPPRRLATALALFVSAQCPAGAASEGGVGAPAAAPGLLAEIEQAMGGLESFSLEIEASIEATAAEESRLVTMRMNGHGRPSGDISLSVNGVFTIGGLELKLDFEVREVAGVSYVQDPRTREWTVKPEDGDNPQDLILEEALAGRLALDGPPAPVREVLAGVAVLKIEGLVGGPAGEQRVAAWVGEEDRRLRKLSIEGPIPLSAFELAPPGVEALRGSTHVTLSDFDRPVEIVAPEIVAGAVAGDAEAPTLVDDEYRFRIDAPGKGWTVLGEAEAQNLVPDAIGGARRHDGGVFGVVIAERAQRQDLLPLARLTLENMTLENKNVFEFVEFEFRERPAVRYEVSGRANEMAVRFRNVVFANEGYLFQVLAWGPESIDRAALEEFAKAVSILPGPVVGRAKVRAVADTGGVGWRVRGGRFESAPYGIVVEPPAGWTLVVGTDLDGMNTAAEVGLTHSRPEVYAIVIAERAAGVPKKAFVHNIVQRTAALGVARDDASYPIELGGRSIRVHRFGSEGRPRVEYHLAVFFEGDICLQLLAWHMDSAADRAQELVTQAFESIRVLGQSERVELARDVGRSPDPQSSVGPGYSLRHGLYRSFEYGFTWRKPEGFWRLTVGQEARAENSDLLLEIEAPELGVFGYLIVEANTGWTDESFHDQVLSMSFDEISRLLAEPPVEVPVGGLTALSSTIEAEADAHDQATRVTTLVTADLALQLSFFGTAGNMKGAAVHLARAIRALSFPGALRPTTLEDDIFTDWRLGLAMRTPGPGWTYQDRTPEAIRGIASLHQWQKGGSEVVVLAICPRTAGQDLGWVEEMMESSMRRRLGQSLGEARRAEGRLDGFPGVRLTWGEEPISGEVLLVNREGSLYALMVTGAATGAGVDLDGVAAGFTFID